MSFEDGATFFCVVVVVVLFELSGLIEVSIKNKKATIANAIKAITIGVVRIEPRPGCICFVFVDKSFLYHTRKPEKTTAPREIAECVD